MPETPRHWAVIMARGASRRMGHPKGALRLAEGGPTFLERIDGLYRALGWPRLVVVREDLEALYRPLVTPDEQRSWLVVEGGRDTARTIQLAHHALAERQEGPGWLWAHPVDVPLVGTACLEDLARAAEQRPERVIRPCFRGQPGHPVGLPAALLARWFPRGQPPPDGPLRQLWDAADVWSLETQDPAVIRDFDDPGALDREKE